MKEERDMNRDPISGEPGSHPVGTGVGGAGGAAAGAAVGAAFGPIGALVGGAIGAVAGGAAGHAAGEAIDPTTEAEYWESEYRNREYTPEKADWNDYHPAYKYGWEARTKHRDREWTDRVESELSQNWKRERSNSSLEWDQAKHAVRDAWDRTDRTYRTYDTTDSYWNDKYQTADYYDTGLDFDRDYKPAYRYGTQARYQYTGRKWDSDLENDLGRDWDRRRGDSRMSWDKAKNAVRDGWHHVERAIPGDFDRDSR